MEFEFDANLSANQNIAKFYQHMETIDPELANLLRTHLLAILPLPEGGTQRAAARQKFNQAILNHLDNKKPNSA